MPNVTGELRDFGIQSLAAYSPRIIFTPSQAAVSSTRLYSTKPIIVTPDLGGAFQVFLQSTDSVSPKIWYSIRIEWLDSDGGYVGADLVDWPLFVPNAGGSIGDLLAVPRPPTLIYVGLTAPLNPQPGMAWLETDPDNPANPLNTGNLYEWSA